MRGSYTIDESYNTGAFNSYRSHLLPLGAAAQLEYARYSVGASALECRDRSGCVFARVCLCVCECL